jgi:hypothetical protein
LNFVYERRFWRFQLEPSVYTQIGDEQMYSDSRIAQDRSTQAKGRENRTQSIATRFTRAEEQVLRTRAAANGQNLREWAREVLLRGEAGGKQP